MEYGILSLIPVVVVLTIAFWRKNVFLALVIGITLATFIISSHTSDYLIGFEAISEVFVLPTTAQVTFFLFLTGAIMYGANKSGGVEGLVVWCTEKKKIVKSKRGVQLLTLLIGMVLFIDALSSIIITASIGRPFFKKYHLPEEKMALLANSTGSGITWMIPISGAGALMAAFLTPIVNDLGIEKSGFELVVSALPFQFYSFSLLIIILVSILTGRELGPIRTLMHQENTYPTTHEEMFYTDIPNKKKPAAINLVLPVLFLVGTAFAIILVTGNGSLIHGNASIAMFASGILTLIFSALLYVSQGIVSLNKYIDWCLEGMRSMFDVILIFVMAYAFGSMLDELDTAGYVVQYASVLPNDIIILAVLLMTSCIAYAIGSSSATVALLFPILIPMAHSLGISIPYILGAIVSGAIFGDQNSPISDSVILTSKISGVDIMTHVRTQIPYTATALAMAFAGFAILNMLS